MRRLITILAALAIPTAGYTANELPSIGAPNGTVRSQPSAIIVPLDPDDPGAGGCVVGSTGCSLPTSGGGGGTSDVNIIEVGGNAVTTALPVEIESGIVTADQGDPGGAPWLFTGSQTDGGAASGGGVRSMGVDGSDNAQDLSVSTTGVLDSPRAGTDNRVITKTSVSASTSTTVCPKDEAGVVTEIQVQKGGIGLGLNGQTLSSVSYGTATTNPDIVLASAGQLYTLPVSATNAITAYGAAQVVVCIQTLRQ